MNITDSTTQELIMLARQGAKEADICLSPSNNDVIVAFHILGEWIEVGGRYRLPAFLFNLIRDNDGTCSFTDKNGFTVIVQCRDIEAVRCKSDTP